MSKPSSRPTVGHFEPGHGSVAGYISGFVLSVYLTLMAYLLVIHRSHSVLWTAGLLATLAFIQFMVQLFFFLHLGRETKPRWKLLAFGFMVGVVIILVYGSLWIMNNLDYHHQLSPAAANQYLQRQDGL